MQSKILNQSKIEETKRNNLQRIEAEMMEKCTFKPKIQPKSRHRVEDDVIKRSDAFMNRKKEKVKELAEKLYPKPKCVPKVNKRKYRPLADEMEHLPVGERLYNYNSIYKTRAQIMRSTQEEPHSFTPYINKNTDRILQNKILIEEELRRRYEEEQDEIEKLAEEQEEQEINELESVDRPIEWNDEPVKRNLEKSSENAYFTFKDEDRIKPAVQQDLAFKLNTQVERCLKNVKDRSTLKIPEKKEELSAEPAVLPENVRKALEAFDLANN